MKRACDDSAEQQQPCKQAKTASDLLVSFFSDQSFIKLDHLVDAISVLSGVEALAMWRCSSVLEGDHSFAVCTALWKRINQDPNMTTVEGTCSLVSAFNSNAVFTHMLLQKVCLNLVDLDAANILDVLEHTVELADDRNSTRHHFLVALIHVIVRDHWDKRMCQWTVDLCMLLTDHVKEETVEMLTTLVSKLSPHELIRLDVVATLTSPCVRNRWAPSKQVSFLFGLVRTIDAKVSPLDPEIVPKSIEAIVALLALQPSYNCARVGYCVELCLRLTNPQVAASFRTMLIGSMADARLRPRLMVIYSGTLQIPESFWNHLDNFLLIWRLGCADLHDLLSEILTTVSANPKCTLSQVLKQVSTMDEIVTTRDLHMLLCNMTVRAIKAISEAEVANIQGFLTLTAKTVCHALAAKSKSHADDLLNLLVSNLGRVAEHHCRKQLVEAAAELVKQALNSCISRFDLVLLVLSKLLDGLPMLEVVSRIINLFNLLLGQTPHTQILIDVLAWWAPLCLSGHHVAFHNLLSLTLEVGKHNPGLNVGDLLDALATVVERGAPLGRSAVCDMDSWPFNL